MKNRKVTIILVSLIILIGSVIFFVYKKENKVYEEVKENKITLAIMVERSENKYVEYKSREWPKYGYRFNPEKTECIDRNKNIIGNLVEYDVKANIAYMKSSRSAFCTLYFDKDNSAPSISEESFYVGSTIDQQYTTKVNEEVHIKIEDDDVMEYCLSLDSDSRSCEGKWNDIPEIDEEGWFKVENFNLGETNGEKIVYLYLKDGARNIASKEDRITLDTEGPSCKLWGESTTWTNGNRTIKWGCEDKNGCKVEEKGSKEYTTTIKIGDEISAYEIEDMLGNKTTCSGLQPNVYVDKDKPTITFGLSGTTATYTCSDTGGSNIVGTSTGTKTLSGTSNITYTATCTDGAGNSKTDSHTYVYSSCLYGTNTCKSGYIYGRWSSESIVCNCSPNATTQCSAYVGSDCAAAGCINNRCYGKQTRTATYSSCATGSNTCVGGFKFN